MIDEQQEQGVVDETEIRQPDPLVGVYHAGDLLEGEKADPQRQQDVQRRKIGLQQGVAVAWVLGLGRGSGYCAGRKSGAFPLYDRSHDAQKQISRILWIFQCI